MILTETQVGIGEFDMPQFTIEVHDPVGKGNGVLHSEGIDNVESFTEQIRKHMVPVSDTAPSTCIDGRPCTECLDGSNPEIGPKVAGAAVITSYAAVELVGSWYASETINLDHEDRMHVVARQLTSSRIPLRAHCDRAAKDSKFIKESIASRTGCGADDNFPVIVTTVQNEKKTVQDISDSVMGEVYSGRTTSYTPAETLASRHTLWQPINMINVVSEYAGAGEVEVLDGQHNEVAVVFNYREGYTIDRDSFVNESGMQVFFIDVWYLQKLADALARGPNAEKQYEELLSAMIDYQVATYLTLCDGTHPVVTVT